MVQWGGCHNAWLSAGRGGEGGFQSGHSIGSQVQDFGTLHKERAANGKTLPVLHLRGPVWTREHDVMHDVWDFGGDAEQSPSSWWTCQWEWEIERVG